jgi:predicted deacetylase
MSRMAAPPALVVSVHDVSPATAEQTARWCRDLDGLGVPSSLLVIPGHWRGQTLADAPDFARVLAGRVRGGDDLVLHGWTHCAGDEGTVWRRAVGQAVARGAAEFAALNRSQAVARLAAGQAVMRQLGLETEGFTPPGWLASPSAIQALAAAGFRYVTTHRGVLSLPDRRLRPGFALSHRPTGGIGQHLAAYLMAHLARRKATHGGLIRIALHPDDLAQSGLRDVTLRTIDGALLAGARPVTYTALARS